MDDGNVAGRSGKRANTKVGEDWRNETSSWGSGGSGGCGKAELLWMADGNGRALGKRANTKVGEDWRNDKRVAAGEAAATGAAEGRAAVDGGWQCARALGKRANTKVGGDWRNEKQ